MNHLVFGGETYRALRDTLLASAPSEAAAFLLAGRSVMNGNVRLLVREVVAVPKDAYSVQQELSLTISPVFLSSVLKRARLEDCSLLLTHTHPFSDNPDFSPVDDQGERVLMPCVFQRAPNRHHGALVLGRSGFAARLWDTPLASRTVEALIEVGRTVRHHLPGEYAFVPADLIFDRSVRAFGRVGQGILSRLAVGIVGLGGTGSLVLEQLAHLGVSRLTLLDTDAVSATNLNRLVGAGHKDIGRAKVDVAADLVRRINPNIEVRALRGSVINARDAVSILGCNFVFSCTDTHGSRAVLNQMAYQYLLPMIDVGVRIDAHDERVEAIAGRVQMLSPSLPCLVCQGLLNSEEVRRDLLSEEERVRDPYIVGAKEPQPAVISINGTVASLAVTMFLAAAVGLPLQARHQLYLADKGTVRVVESIPTSNCVVCSLHGALARGDTWPLPWRTA